MTEQLRVHPNNDKLMALQFANGNLDNAKAIYAWLCESKGDGPGVPPVAVDPGKTSKAPAKDKPAKVTETKTETPKDAAPAELSSEDRAKTYAETIRPKVLAAVAATDKEKVRGMIKAEFKVDSATDLDPAKWPALLEKCDALIAAAAEKEPA